MKMAKREQPAWKPPVLQNRPQLKLYNSLTRKKEVFMPLQNNNIMWYSCGPTVYDASHMGHARSYISFDILRRTLANYFGYNVLYVMNITDIDDKIIKRARQNYLYEKYILETADSLDQLLNDQKKVYMQFQSLCNRNLDTEKKIMLENTLHRMQNAIDALIQAVNDGNESLISKMRSKYLEEARDPISEWLDSESGPLINDNSIFQALPQYWEDEFHNDMRLLNVLPPDVLTRVSEYVPVIVSFIERIINNGFAYVANKSVYFDVNGFDKRDNHHYAKLVPEAYGDTKALQEGEGDLFLADDRLSGKRSPNDFALWKTSKAGEPWWDSPWGPGRPGWHIECSAMASDIFGSKFDIHTGGIDLKFPHHDNELAQSEAAFGEEEWVKYFLHTGHLTIAGCKMSKSLKNFITIKEALKRHTTTQLRLAFLLHSWKDTLDYSENTMEMATQYEKFLNEFFLNVKDLTRHVLDDQPRRQFDSWNQLEATLQKKYTNAKEEIHTALCDNIDTRSVLDIMRELVAACNIYIRENKVKLNSLLLRNIATYLTDMLHIFGAISGPRGGIGFPMTSASCSSDSNVETIAMPYVEALATFRTQVREHAKSSKDAYILKLSDALRDDVLPNLGVRLEDKDGATFAVKFVDRDSLMREHKLNKMIEAERNIEKQRKQRIAAEGAAAKEAQRRVSPKDMFLSETEKFSVFDKNGLPTHDKDGKEISKGQLKKLQKLQQQQEQRYKEYLASINTS